MKVFAVYFNPKDYPGKHVVRGYTLSHLGIVPDPEPTIVCDSLKEARDAIPRGLFRMPPSPQDDPTIIETWI